MKKRSQEYKIHIIELPEELLEVRYYESSEDSTYLSWKIPVLVVEELTVWWREKKSNEKPSYPLKGRTKSCEITINSETTICIREFDKTGRYKTIGWSLPKGAMEELMTRGRG